MYYTGPGTKRLYIRPLTKDDIPVWAEYFTYPEATRFISQFFPSTDPYKISEDFIGKQFLRYAENRYGHQALIHKTTGEFMGVCGLLLQNIQGVNEIEIGYHLFPKFWHRGYATEASQHFRDFAFHNKLTTSIISVIDTENYASQNVAIRNGMTQERKFPFGGSDHYIYRITREEWEIIK
jgi:ribosomal-protein-alanine N-acetyltransferase